MGERVLDETGQAKAPLRGERSRKALLGHFHQRESGAARVAAKPAASAGFAHRAEHLADKQGLELGSSGADAFRGRLLSCGVGRGGPIEGKACGVGTVESGHVFLQSAGRPAGSPWHEAGGPPGSDDFNLGIEGSGGFEVLQDGDDVARCGADRGERTGQIIHGGLRP